MTKKDYTLIAQSLANLRAKYGQSEPSLALVFNGICNDHANAIADMLQSDNPRFDRSMFLAACGVLD